MAASYLRRAWLAAFGALCLGACLSPTLPLPPPSKPVVEGPDTAGNVTLSGNVTAGATVYAQNLVTLEGRFQTTPTGAYVIVLPAQSGDEISLWYSLGTDDSPSVVFRVP